MTVDVLTVGRLQTTCYLVSDGTEAVCIDPGDEAERILSAAAARGVRISLVLLTHAHADHFLAADAVRRASGAPLALLREDAQALRSQLKTLLPFIAPATRLPVPAERELTDGETVTVGSLCLTVCASPGHTPGGACYAVEAERTVFTGDTAFAGGGFGRTDFPGGDSRALQCSLQRLYDRFAGWTAYAGHGPAFTM